MALKKTKYQKVQSWTTKDIVLNVLVYVLNVALISLIFVGTIIMNEVQGGQKYGKYFESPVQFLHFFTLLLLLVALMATYLFFEDRDFFKRASNSEMIFLIIEVSLIVCYFSGSYIYQYVRPLTLAALLTLFLTDRRKAIFVNILYCLLTFLFDQLGTAEFNIGEYPVLIMGFTSGMLAIFCMDKVYSRIKLLVMSLLITLPTVICISMMVINIPSESTTIALITGACSGPLAVSAFMVLLPVFEAIFTRVSSFRLSELTEHKSKLIRKMIQQAPGTFNHSIVVSNIAEACATAIGEDALLARTCAYYHDVGKLRRPEFFKENQADGNNPHDDLTPELSTNILKSHAIDGYNLVIKNRLPREIADVCIQHHGTMPILFFYAKAQKFTDGEVDISQYCYAGPKPQTKIAAIIMIADGCEAAVRTLQDRSRAKVDELVRKIVNDRMKLGQFEECEITLKEINIIIHTVVNNLTGIYHNRIEYPKVEIDGTEE
ncbi:MAG: HDIG domain-containing protein [Clostridia bacterium]|nr:HDIG domain-containing protein [Clostridia bacterium]